MASAGERSYCVAACAFEHELTFFVAPVVAKALPALGLEGENVDFDRPVVAVGTFVGGRGEVGMHVSLAQERQDLTSSSSSRKPPSPI